MESYVVSIVLVALMVIALLADGLAGRSGNDRDDSGNGGER